MSSFLEFEGKNVDQAVSAACDELNVKKKQLKYKVISHGSTGIFGLVGMKKAKIRVQMADAETDVDPDTAAAPETVLEAETVPENETAAEIDTIPNVDREADEPAVIEEEEPEEPDEPHEVPEPGLEEEAEGSQDSEGNFENLKSMGEGALQTIVSQISSEAEVHFSGKNGNLAYEILGGSSALLIGKNGQTLEAIQYIVEKIVNKQAENRVRVEVDIEGYRASKQENLRSLAMKLAEKTKRTGKPSTIGQMNAQDRRLVHLALKDEKGVRTQSMGDGYMRKLVIFPKKGSGRKRKGSGS